MNSGEIPVGYQEDIELMMINKGRGFAWGSVVLEPVIPGLTVPQNFNSLDDNKISIHIDIIDVKPGIYNSNLFIHLEGIQKPHIVFIHYQVIKLNIYIEPSEINLGTINFDKRWIQTEFKVFCQPSNGRIKGNITNDRYQLKVKPHNFEGSLLNFIVEIDTSFLGEGALYKDEICLNTNTGNYRVNLKFKTPKRLESILGIFAFVISFVLSLFLIYPIFYGFNIAYSHLGTIFGSNTMWLILLLIANLIIIYQIRKS